MSGNYSQDWVRNDQGELVDRWDGTPKPSVEPFCDGKWYAGGYSHSCLKREGHDGACWCCDAVADGYPGGDLSVLEESNEL